MKTVSGGKAAKPTKPASTQKKPSPKKVYSKKAVEIITGKRKDPPVKVKKTSNYKRPNK